MKLTITAERKSADSIFLQWEASNVRERDEYELMFAASETEDMRVIGRTRCYNFLHEDGQLVNNHRVRYQLRKKKEVSEVIYPENNGDSYLYALANTYHWQLRYSLLGVKCNVYCYTSNKVYCPECWSETANKRYKDACDTCDGSGELRGYTGPCETFINIQDGRETETYVGGVMKPRFIYNSWMGNYPLVNKKDVFVDNNKNVYMVIHDPERTTCGSLQNSRFIVKQAMVVEKLSKDNPFYKYLEINRG